jgi:hypothetical protein
MHYFTALTVRISFLVVAYANAYVDLHDPAFARLWITVLALVSITMSRNSVENTLCLSRATRGSFHLATVFAL